MIVITRSLADVTGIFLIITASGVLTRVIVYLGVDAINGAVIAVRRPAILDLIIDTTTAGTEVAILIILPLRIVESCRAVVLGVTLTTDVVRNGGALQP